jgi:HD-GYP domain-containing protein (c-di-GMP phosphodiesterase class II)
VTIDKKLLNSSKTLNDAEITMIQSHVEVGYRLLSSTPDKGAIADIVLSHHENVDGSGYPRKIEKASIPLLSRMLRIVETYDILTNKTPYSNAMSKDKAAREMLRYAGTWYDKTLLESFLSKTIKVRI